MDLELVPSIDLERIFFGNKSNGSRDGAVVRALASHQCGPGSILGLGVICGLSLLLVLVPAPRVFLRVLQFSSLHKNQHFQIPVKFDLETVDRRATPWNSLKLPFFSPNEC